MSKLIPLRVSPNWAVLHNSFYDEEMIVKNGEIENFLSYQEDILFLKQCTMSSEGYEIKNEGYSIDLGWYPDSDPNGQYRLSVIKSDWNNVLFKYNSRNSVEIVKVIESCLECIVTTGFDKEEILKKAFEE